MKENRKGAREGWLSHPTMMEVWLRMKRRGENLGWKSPRPPCSLRKLWQSHWRVGQQRSPMSPGNESALVFLLYSITGGEQSMEEVAFMHMRWWILGTVSGALTHLSSLVGRSVRHSLMATPESRTALRLFLFFGCAGFFCGVHALLCSAWPFSSCGMQGLLLLWHTGSRPHGLSSCGTWA